VTLALAKGSFRPLLAEDGTELLDETGATMYAEPTGAAVTLSLVAPTVTLAMKEAT
jgi:hypothetical protein